MSRPTIWIADSPERLPFVRHLTEKLDYHWITDHLGEIDDPPGPIDLIIVSDERYFSWLSDKIDGWRERRIPTLHVADGICEWRNIFDNPHFDRGDCATAPLYQPVQTDKIAWPLPGAGSRKPRQYRQTRSRRSSAARRSRAMRASGWPGSGTEKNLRDVGAESRLHAHAEVAVFAGNFRPERVV